MIKKVHPCPVCSGEAPLFDVLDLNKSCEVPKSRIFGLAGVPVYYARCDSCGFCFAPELAGWSLEEFEQKIYNDDYVAVDPDYVEARPRANANNLITMFANQVPSIRHLDYGGGSGLLTGILKQAGWESLSYDPFVDRQIAPHQLGTFDLITAFEVFEHVPDVDQLMSTLKSLLAPGGLILFSTLLSDGHIPAGQRLTWWYAAPRNGHISLFAKKSLEHLSRKTGFRFASFSPNFHVFFSAIPAWASHIIRTG